MKKSWALICLVVALVPAWGTAAGSQTPDGKSGCEQQHVLLLMDESGSLRKTDPNALRVEAAALLIEALAPTSADRPPVTLRIAGFGSGYSEYGEYSLPADRGAAVSEVQRFRERNRQRNTDYVVALRESARHFASIDAPVDCKTLIWFTDGGHDLEFPDDPASRVGTYTAARNPLEVTSQLGGLVCGPVPPNALLAAPVRTEILNSGFRIVISELQIASPDERERTLLGITHPVLERLVRVPGGDCAVPGEWETVATPEQLASSFVARAQEAVGAKPVDCRLLSSGQLRSDVVESVAFRLDSAQPATLRIGDQSQQLSGRIIDQDISAADRAVGVPISVATSGRLIDCYARLEAGLRFRSDPVLFQGASASAVELIVAGPEFASESSVGPELVSLALTADGTPIATEFDTERRVWTATLPSSAADQVLVQGSAVLAGVDGPQIELARLDETIKVSDVPPSPSLAWTGDLSLEGEGEIDGAIRLTPQTTVEGAQYCATLVGENQTIEAVEDGAPVAELRSTAGEVCGPADVDTSFDIDALIAVSDESNSTGKLLVSYSATYVDPSGVRVPVAENELVDAGRLAFTKAPDRLREALIVAALVLASILAPILLLWLFNAWQGKLVPPRSLKAMETPVEITRGGHGRHAGFVVKRSPQHPVRLDTQRAIDGTRTRWSLPGGLVAKRRLPFNPFGTPTSRISTARSQLVSSIGHSDGNASVVGPVRFSEAVFVSLDPIPPDLPPDRPVQATAVVVSRPGLVPSDLEQMLDDGLARCGPKIKETDASAAHSEQSLASLSEVSGEAAPSTPPPSSPPQSSSPPPAPPRNTGSAAGSTPKPRPPAPPR